MRETIVNVICWLIQQLIMFVYVVMGLSLIIMIPAICEGNTMMILPALIICGIFYATYRAAVRLEPETQEEEMTCY